MGYAFVGLRTLERQRASLLMERQGLVAETDQYRRDLTSVRADLAKSRASLAAARAAINAFHAGRLEDAVSLYDEALAPDPDNAYIQNLRAYSLFRLGRIEAAIEGQRRSLAADPDYAWGYFDLARFLYAASPPRLDEARQAEAKAIELRPGMRSIMQADGEFQRLRRRRAP
jgi:tetratricopeptide (TPR) repeat protein